MTIRKQQYLLEITGNLRKLSAMSFKATELWMLRKDCMHG